MIDFPMIARSLLNWRTQNSCAQDRGQPIRAAAGFFFVKAEGAAELGADPEGVEEIARDREIAQALRGAVPGQSERALPESGELGEALVLGPEIEEIRITDGVEPVLADGISIERAPGDQLVRRGEGKRLEEDGVDHAKDGGVGPNPEGEGDDGDKSETRLFPELAERVTEVREHDGVR